jgi:hypothetical protein
MEACHSRNENEVQFSGDSFCCSDIVSGICSLSDPTPSMASALEDMHAQGIPATLQQSRKGIVPIPDAIAARLFPSPDLSLRSMLEFIIPISQSVNTVNDISSFFKKENPHQITSLALMTLSRLSIPTFAIVEKLLRYLPQAQLDGYRSVVYVHLGNSLGTYYPLWVVSFWSRVGEFREAVKGPWLKADDWVQSELRQKRSAERVRLAEEVNMLLTMLPWGVAKQGVSNMQPIHSMHRLLGRERLDDSLQDDRLSVLRQWIIGRPHLLRKLRVEGTALTNKIMSAYNMSKDHSNTYQSPAFSWIRMLGADMVQNKQTLLTSPHDPARKHWLALVVDTEKNIIYFGDSLRKPIPGPLFSAYTWWISQHTLAPFKLQELPISQQSDDHSCGPLATNAICHFADPDMFALAEASAGSAIEHMRSFCLMGQHVLDGVSL